MFLCKKYNAAFWSLEQSFASSPEMQAISIQVSSSSHGSLGTDTRGKHYNCTLGDAVALCKSYSLSLMRDVMASRGLRSCGGTEHIF